MIYDPKSTSDYYDALAEKEWERLSVTPRAEVSLYLHTQMLKRFINPGAQVLEIGAGPGRFTMILAELGAQVWVGDLSPVQVELNQKFADRYGFEHAVVDRRVADICDLCQYNDSFYDAVVALGGPLSYALDRRDGAVSECLRVLQPGGYLLCSVMSMWGTAHWSLKDVLALDPAVNLGITSTGDLTAETFPGRKGHFMHMFRAAELRSLLERRGFEVLAMSSSGSLSIGWDEELMTIRQDANRWQELLRMELEACAEPGALDMGTHLLAAARKCES